MKRGLASATLVALVVVLGTAAFAPSVWAQVGEVFRWRFALPNGGIGEIILEGPVEQSLWEPSYLPAGFQAGRMTFNGAPGAQSTELIYHNQQQFVAITQSKAPADKTLPPGTPVQINGRPAVLVVGLDGTMQIGPNVPEGAQVTTAGTPAPGAIAYMNGKRLTWYAGDVRMEMLSNLPQEEVLKVAELLRPAVATQPAKLHKVAEGAR